MTNPFDLIQQELSDIKVILKEMKKPGMTNSEPKKSLEFKLIPIQDIFNKKICSRPCFYSHVKAGDFTLYKFGNKSFVDKEEFLKAFHKVKFDKKRN